MNTRKSALRFSIPILLLFATGFFLHARAKSENVPASENLSAFPLAVGEWKGHDVPLRKDVLDLLGPGEFLSRFYVNGNSTAPFIDFFVAYFPSQKTGNSAHSPRNCLPGSGWYFAEIRPAEVTLPGAKPFEANRAIIQKGLDRQLMYYWYQSHGRRIASEYTAKYFLIADAIRYNRTDGSIVRVITTIAPNEDIRSADARVQQFMSGAVPNLPRFIPD
jgi:EpsI family protein